MGRTSRTSWTKKSSARVAAGLACLALAVAGTAGRALGQEPRPRANLAVVIELDGKIDHFTATTLESRVKSALERSPRFLIISIDSPGGELEASKAIAYNLLRLPESVPGVRTVAFVRSLGLSGAAIVALGCDEIAMSREAELGAVLPFQMKQFLDHVEIEFQDKFIGPVANELKYFAEKRGYPVDAAVKMADPRFDLLRVDVRDAKTGRSSTEWVAREAFESWPSEKRARVQGDVTIEVPKGKLLTVKAEKARALGFAKYEARDVTELLRLLESEYSLPTLQSEAVRGYWWEEVVRFLTWPSVRVVLFVIGVIALLIALTHPGLGVAEAATVAAFGLCFFGSYLIGLATAIDLVVFVLGVALVATEILGGFPGHGLIGLLGGILIFTSLLLSLQNFVVPSNPEEWEIFKGNLLATGEAIALTVLGLASAARFLPKTRLFARLVNADEQAADFTAHAQLPPAAVAGARGVVVTELRPAGKVEIEGVLLDATAEAGFVARGTRIVVVARRGPEVVVAPAEAPPAPGGTAPPAAGEGAP